MTDSAPNPPPNGNEKDAADVRVFPPGVPLVIMIAGAVMERFLPLDSEHLLPAPLRYWIGGVIIIASIYFLGFRAVSIMRATGQSENPYKKTTEILEAGPYRFTRNPMYLQMVFVCIGVGIALSNIWILILSPFCALLLQILVIQPEEAYLERKFGDTYLAYKKRVRRWI